MACALRLGVLVAAGVIPLAAQGRGGGFRQPDPIDFNDHAGFTQIFDGTTLKGWDGDPTVWKADRGAIVGTSPAERPVGTTFLIWRDGEPADFELKLEVRVEGAGANTGIQYRSRNVTPSFGRGPRPANAPGRGSPAPAIANAYVHQARWDLAGYQADFDLANLFTGQLMESNSARFIMTWWGQVVQAQEGRPPRLLASLGNKDALSGFVKLNDWNEYHIIARGHQLMHIVNGHLMSLTFDDDPAMTAVRGLIGLQIEGNGRVKVSFRNLWLRTL